MKNEEYEINHLRQSIVYLFLTGWDSPVVDSLGLPRVMDVIVDRLPPGVDEVCFVGTKRTN